MLASFNSKTGSITDGHHLFGIDGLRHLVVTFGGNVDDVEKRVVFDNEDNEEKFHNMYDLEPDEQSRNVLECWYGKRPFHSWIEIFDRYKSSILDKWLHENQIL